MIYDYYKKSGNCFNLSTLNVYVFDTYFVFFLMHKDMLMLMLYEHVCYVIYEHNTVFESVPLC